jgi:hypothetical protein
LGSRCQHRRLYWRIRWKLDDHDRRLKRYLI